ncbi:MAG: NYN domain-containing protein [Sphingomonadales bacterium]|nr:NYN domain-containing protein [Sphingomonadales bacterium]
MALRIGPSQITQQISNNGPQLLETPSLYRIFFYDCPPLTKRMHKPISQTSIVFSKTEDAIFRIALHEEIQKLRKLAIRLGRLNDTSKWRLSEQATARLIKDPTLFVPTDDDFEIDTKQKGVDMRLGLDVASLAFKRQVDQIVIVAADADFVPAAKLARREGIDIVLDRMSDHRAAKDLIEHVDGIRDCFLPKPYD